MKRCSENQECPHFPPRLRESYELIVAGGGIYGAAVAWEAASRGLQTLLLEADDFGSGTSANSLRTIHGGIRYLQTLNVPRMRASVRERRALLRIAPHLVRPLECVMPAYRGSGKSALALWAGLELNDLLSADRNLGVAAERRIPAGKLISAQTLSAKAPALHDDRITGGACWFDAQAHDAERLVLSFVMSAVGAGADALNHCAVTGLVMKDGRVSGAQALDERSGAAIEVGTKALIDCTGPWAGSHEWCPQAEPVRGQQWARGMNLVLRRRVADCALGVLPAPAEEAAEPGRLLFVAPWREGSLAGTWYYPDQGDPDALQPDEAEVKAALDQLRGVLPDLRLDIDDVTQVHLGLLPATGREEHSEPELESRYRISAAAESGGPRGLYVISGVKYTTARQVAECTIDRLVRDARLNVSKSVSARRPLYGADFSDGPDAYLDASRGRYSARLPAGAVKRMIGHYGRRFDRIMELSDADPTLAEAVPGYPLAIRAELEHAIADEMAWTLGDLLLRRTGIASFALPARETVDFAAGFMAARLGWDEDRKLSEIQALEERFPSWRRMSRG